MNKCINQNSFIIFNIYNKIYAKCKMPNAKYKTQKTKRKKQKAKCQKYKMQKIQNAKCQTQNAHSIQSMV